MTDQMFHRDLSSPTVPPLAPAERIGRWVLHRAGIRNVWQYDQCEISFAGGRALLRGKNGAGKSKALEVLLPFLLDGDSRSIDAAGRDRTTVLWLMTDGRPAGHHIGYVWLELRLTDEDGGESFCTLGAGLRASTSTRRPDTWFFLTERRVGVDVILDPDGDCLAFEPLKALLGEDAVTASAAEHRRRVGLRLFGLRDDARYGNLLHLLHRLRDPNIGNRVEAGELAAVLGDALPPLEEDVVTDAATRLDDLELVRQQLERTEQTANALGRFLEAYRGYTRTVLRQRAEAVRDAEQRRRREARAARALAEKVQEATRAAAAAADHVVRLRTDESGAAGEREALRESDAYRSHLDLAQRQLAVAARRQAAAIAGRAADEATVRQREAAADVERARTVVADRSGEATATFDRVSRLATEADVDPALLRRPPVPGDEGTIDEGAITAARASLDAAGSVVDGRRRHAEEVRRLAIGWREAAEAARHADERAAVSESELAAHLGDVDGAHRALVEASREWASGVGQWTEGEPSARSGVDWSALLRSVADHPLDRDGPAAAAALAGTLLAPAQAQARGAAAAAELERVRAEEVLAAARARRDELEAQEEARPAANAYRRAERDPASGAAFYELVDLAPGLDATTSAGIEAALEAAGILDAWVTAEGVVTHPRTEDVVVRVDGSTPPAGVATLARALVPVSDPGGPVGAETVQRVLNAIAVGEHASWPTWVTADGRWCNGALRGAWSKPEVEFIGAGARRATRRRQLDELAASIQLLSTECEAAEQAAADAAGWSATLDRLPASFPGAGLLDAAHAQVDLAGRLAASARLRHEGDRRAAEAARAVAARARSELDHAAATDGLPADVDALDALLVALREMREAVGDHRRTLRDLGDAASRLVDDGVRWQARRSQAEASAREAAAVSGEAEQAALELTTLEAAVGASVREVLDRLAAVEGRLQRVRQELPAAEHADKDAGEERVRAVERHGHAEAAASAATDAVVAAGGVLARALVLPGVALAAMDREVASIGDILGSDAPTHVAATTATETTAAEAVAAAEAVLVRVADGQAVTDRFILARYDDLQEALAGGYDTAADEDDGVKVFHVADDSGRQPLAVVARRVAREAEAARSRLAEREREVLERFLLRELADELHDRLLEATDLVEGANRSLAGVRTSHGKGVRLDWRLREDAPPAASAASRLLIDDLRTEQDDVELRDALIALIGAEREADRTAGYEQHLRQALDYRRWYEFRVRVLDGERPGTSRALSARAGLSQGEQRVLSYLALFAAATAHFDALARTTPQVPRLLLLDDAFAKVDEPTHGRLLELLVAMNLDFLITSERLWGCFPAVPSLEIYEALRDAAVPGVALVHFHWDGKQRHLVGV